MPNKAKVSDVYGITVEVEVEAEVGHVELLAAVGAEFERLSGLLDRPRTTAGAGFTTHLPPTPARTVPPARAKPRGEP